MKFVQCPLIGRRALSEFTYGGIVEKEPDQATVDEAGWTEYVFYRHSHPQTQKEWWYHRPSGIWFWFERNTLTDEISDISPAVRGALA